VQVRRARGQFTEATGRLQIERGDVRGVMLLRYQVLKFIGVGLDFFNGPRHLSFFAGKGWLRRHLAPMQRAAEDKHPVPRPRCCVTDSGLVDREGSSTGDR
jgi:hypothetical protein